MTDEESCDQLGWFRTPLAAGMASGVLAGVANLLVWYVALRLATAGSELRGMGGQTWVCIMRIPADALLLCGPVIVLRRWKSAAYALAWAVAFCPANIALAHVSVWFMRAGARPGSAALNLWWVVSAVASGAVFGLVLAWLYGYKPYTVRAPVFGALAAAVVTACNALLRTQAAAGVAQTMTPHDVITVQTMTTLISCVILSMAPALAIEWDLRRRARRAARLSNASAGTEDEQ